jgi:addiction module HigA family antidote
MMTMHNPSHPGELIREDVLVPLGLSVTDAAMKLGVSRSTLSRVVNCRAAVSADMALRLEKAGISKADLWLGMQLDYDLWQARQHEPDHVSKLAESA